MYSQNVYNFGFCVLLSSPGGRIGKKPCQALEVLDLTTKPTPEWTTLTDEPTKLVFSCYLSTDTHLYRLGGLHETQQGVQPKFEDTVSEYCIEDGELHTIFTPINAPSLINAPSKIFPTKSSIYHSHYFFSLFCYFSVFVCGAGIISI